MFTLLLLAGLGLAGWYGFRWVKKSDHLIAELVRFKVWGEYRKRP
jgi:hypothetical protein